MQGSLTFSDPSEATARAALSALGFAPSIGLAALEGGWFRVLGADSRPFATLAVGADATEPALAARLGAERFATLGLLAPQPGAPQLFERRVGSDRLERVARIDAWAPPAADVPRRRRGVAGPRGLVPLERRLEGVFFETHSHMRDIDGLHAPEAVDELCKLLFLKLQDEVQTAEGQALNLQRAQHGSLEAYASAARRQFDAGVSEQGPGGGSVWSDILLSNAALVRCLDQLEPYSLLETAGDIKGRAFQNVVRPAARAGMGQYFTPEVVGSLMVRVLDPTVDDRVLDPFAGSAHFLALALQHVQSRADAPLREDYCARALFGVEKSQRMMRVAWTDLLLHGHSGLRLRCADSLGPLGHLPSFALGSFDAVVTNPPFGAVLRADAIARLGEYATAEGRATVPLEVLALERAIRFLRPGGRIAIVLPDGVLGNQRTEGARAVVGGLLAVRAVLSLPDMAFTPFGANVKTSVLFGRRLLPGEGQDDDAAVFLGRLDDLGYDGTGRATDGSEVDAMAGALRDFFDREGW